MVDHEKLSNGEDRVFWERLKEMPWTEAEQECVSRREELCLQLAVLETRLQEVGRTSAEGRELGGAKIDIQAQLTLVGERMKYLRRVMDQVKWRTAVITVCGPEVFQECAIWIAAQEESIRAATPL